MIVDIDSEQVESYTVDVSQYGHTGNHLLLVPRSRTQHVAVMRGEPMHLQEAKYLEKLISVPNAAVKVVKVLYWHFLMSSLNESGS